MLESFKNNPHMWDGFAGAESWSEDLAPLFAVIEYEDGDGCLLIADRKGVQVFFEEWNDHDGEAWSMNMEEQSHEYILAFALGLATQLKDLNERDEATTFLSRAGFTLV